MPTSVSYIFQDKTGFLWFGTNSGLYKYDGYSFTSYKHELEDTTTIIDNNLTTLYEDKEWVLWIGSYLGIEKYNPPTNTFVHYTPNPSGLGKDASNNVWTICEDKYGMLWIGTGDGLYRFDKTLGKFTSFRYDSTDPGSISHNSLHVIYEDKERELCFGTDIGLDKLDFKTGRFIHFWSDPLRRKMTYHDASRYWINSILKDDAGTIWLGTNAGLIEFNLKERKVSNYLFNPENPLNRITSISQDLVSNCLWLGTWEGLFSFDKKTKEFSHYDSQPSVVCSERSGTLWIGTNTDIRKLNRTKQPFKKYPSRDIICAIGNQTERILWMYAYHGNEWLKFDIRKEKFVPYSFGKGNKPYFIYPGGELIIKRAEGGCLKQDSLGKITSFFDDSLKEFVNSLSCGWRTKKGYWHGTHQGGFYFHDPQTHRVKKIRDLKLDINYIYEDSFGLLWIATFMGKVFCYNPERDSLVEFTSDTKNISSTTGRIINQIYQDKKGRLWFATSTGLNQLVRSTSSLPTGQAGFIHFTEKDGLPSNNVRGILEDDHGYLWLNTSKGISKFNPETNLFKNYDVSYGLELASDVFYGFGCKTSNGEMYFGGAKGFTRFHPDSIKDNSFIPPIVITSFRKFDKPYPFSDEVRLPHDENFISFEFAALSYMSPERNQYAYKMEGLDNDWVYSGTRRYASYPNLEPGEYVFRVKGSNNDGLWNEAGTSLSIIISPPWWKTTSAYILYSILILSVIYFTWKLQVKRIRIGHEYEMSRFESEKLHEVDEMKSRFFANISHEFRTPHTLILGPVKQIIEITKEEKTRNELRVVHKNANRLLGLVDQLLDISKLESGNMKLQTIPQNIIPLLKALTLSFTSYAERKRIALTFNSVEDEILVYIDRDKIEKIITNVLSNAFKFTPEGGKIEVAVTPKPPFNSPLPTGQAGFTKGGKEGCSVEISISDTGIGIPGDKIPKIFDRFYQVDGSHTREQEGTGIGLSLTKELVELHKGKIEVESEEGKGTTFIISIPLGKEHLKAEEICESEREEEQVSFVPEEMMYHARLDSTVKSRQEETKTEKPAIRAITETEKPLLLIVEDNSDVRTYIKNNVNKDYRVLEAIDGEDGWNKSIESRYGGPDVIVSDVMMPKMDGFRLCDKLKTDERTSHIPVILLTAKASSQDKIEGFETGADDYIMKPFDPEELKARIKNLIEQRKRIHEHFRKHGLFEIEEEHITPVDQKFLQKTVTIMNEHISDASFGVEMLADEMAISRSLLLKKIEALIGEPPNELIKRTRLNKAAKLIESRFGNISEIALEVGFSNPSYFAECFKKQFGFSPSQYHHSPANQ